MFDRMYFAALLIVILCVRSKFFSDFTHYTLLLFIKVRNDFQLTVLDSVKIIKIKTNIMFLIYSY